MLVILQPLDWQLLLGVPGRLNYVIGDMLVLSGIWLWIGTLSIEFIFCHCVILCIIGDIITKAGADITGAMGLLWWSYVGNYFSPGGGIQVY